MNPIDTKLAEISGATAALNLACDTATPQGTGSFASGLLATRHAAGPLAFHVL